MDYALDDVDNYTQRVDQQGTHTYVYDDRHRLTSVTYPGPNTMTYDFDAFGNREEMTTGAGTTTYAYDDADRLTEVDPPAASPVAYTWDDNGNLTDRGSDAFAWDYEDRMVEATVNSVTTTFVYRGDGLRDSRAVSGGATTTFTWDIASGLPVVLDDGNQCIYGAGLVSMKQSGNWVGILLPCGRPRLDGGRGGQLRQQPEVLPVRLRRSHAQRRPHERVRLRRPPSRSNHCRLELARRPRGGNREASRAGAGLSASGRTGRS